MDNDMDTCVLSRLKGFASRGAHNRIAFGGIFLWCPKVIAKERARMLETIQVSALASSWVCRANITFRRFWGFGFEVSSLEQRHSGRDPVTDLVESWAERIMQCPYYAADPNPKPLTLNL